MSEPEYCLRCDEPVTEDPVWISAGEVAEGGQLVFRDRAQHRECSVRSVAGSAGHLAELCSCFGGDIEDPPGLTKRQAAKLAYRLWLRMMRIADGEDSTFRLRER